MKKILALFLASVLVVGSLSGCAPKEEGGKVDPSPSQSSSSPNASAEKPKLGVFTMGDTSTASGQASELAVNTILDAAGIEKVQVQLGGYDNESFITMYESMVAQDVDAALAFSLSESVLPLLKDLFEQNSVKYFLFNRKLSTPEMEASILGSPMCLGNEHTDETQNAYDMVKHLKETYDIKNMAVLGLTKGDINGDFRDAGIEKACADFGINLLTEARGIVTTEDVTKTVDGFVASYPEMDSIFIVGAAITTGALAGVNQSLVNHKLQDKVTVAMIDISTGMSEYMDDGPLKLVAGGNLIADQIFSMVLMANALHGTPLGEPPVLNVKMFWLTNSEDAKNYDKYIEGKVSPFSAEEYETQMFKWMNPDVTFESVQEIANNFSIASVMERNADKFN